MSEEYIKMIEAVISANIKIAREIKNLRLVNSASNKEVITLDEAHIFFGTGWSNSELRKYMVIPGKSQTPIKEGLTYGKHYFHTGSQFYVHKKEFERFLIGRDKALSIK